MPLFVSEHYDLNSKKVMQFVFDEYVRIFKSPELKKNIAVVHWNQEYALTAPKRLNPNQQEDYVIYLEATNSYWCQIIYQFAHEMSHLIMKCYPEEIRYKWISECFCAAASLYMLELSKQYFKMQCQSYVSAVQGYLQSHIKKSCLPEHIKIGRYIQEHIKELEVDPTEDGKRERVRNDIIAVSLYDMIIKNEEGWKAVELFENINDIGCVDSIDFIQRWRDLCRNGNEEVFVDGFLFMNKNE